MAVPNTCAKRKNTHKINSIIIDKVVNYTSIRNNLAQVMTEVNEDKIVAHITRRNGNNCVLMAEDKYSSLIETLYLLTSKANAAWLEESVAQAENGRFIDIEL
ncbi:type II toxin-antitoxin system Phd/YefM family antitoxin [Neisseria iguanae]|uniref:Antitoxin n=1 Tax=Neisseria iguanae TaxID=90242 RepID=A0A2P7U2T3_9NEIS|nr:type II toxin-antitoxin system prevent-host-death family antitoxin [Neisseria iguanae]PSJ81267.1 type II toxin-antitoxin system prevent-host-death family antitoxin [Neisseria iguanae]